LSLSCPSIQVFVDTVGDAAKWQARLESKYPGVRSGILFAPSFYMYHVSHNLTLLVYDKLNDAAGL
jgi:hypothetical protein